MNIDDTSTIVIDPQVIPTLALGYYFTFTNLPYTKSNDTLRVVLSGPNVGEHIKRINPTIHRYGELSYSTWHQTDTYTFKGYTDSTKFEIVMWKKKQ